ncbi:hypothetical protein ALC60_14195, partial [Trachymyrmex zeteki]
IADVREREKIARENQRTSKKHRALKTGRIEESMALDRHFKPIIKPVQQIVDRAIKRESRDDDAASAPKHERKEEEVEEEEEASETFERSATLSSGARRKGNGIDSVYGVYLHKDGLMFGNKRFDVDDTDNIIIRGIHKLSDRWEKCIASDGQYFE